MAMLAEKRKRVKYCLNPNGNLWNNDDSKFGQKLLEKMGWKKGQGLGANNQGITERLKLAYKFDSTGLGFAEKDTLSQQQNDFQILLSELNGESIGIDDQYKVASLEEKSKKSKSRVHYKKFTRGKDISRYSSKDLSSILGTEVSDKSVTPNSEMRSNGNLVYRGFINSYFDKKLNKSSVDMGAEVGHEKESLMVNSNQSGEGEEIGTAVQVSGAESEIETNLKKKRKKNKFLGIFNNESEKTDELVNEKHDRKRKKHKKSKKNKNVSECMNNDFNIEIESSREDSMSVSGSKLSLKNDVLVQVYEAYNTVPEREKCGDRNSVDQHYGTNGQAIVCRELKNTFNEIRSTICKGNLNSVDENDSTRKTLKKKKHKSDIQDGIVSRSQDNKEHYEEQPSTNNELEMFCGHNENNKKHTKKSKKRKLDLTEENTALENDNQLKEHENELQVEKLGINDVEMKMSYKDSKRKKKKELANEIPVNDMLQKNHSERGKYYHIKEVESENHKPQKNKCVTFSDIHENKDSKGELSALGSEEINCDNENDTNTSPQKHSTSNTQLECLGHEESLDDKKGIGRNIFDKKENVSISQDTEIASTANDGEEKSVFDEYLTHCNDVFERKRELREFKKKAVPNSDDFIGSNLNSVKGYGI